MANHRENISGLLLLDKPLGISSNKALQDAKYLLNAKKAGHTGSLDPLATGLLPLCFGEATKLSHYLLDADKKYTATFRLGQCTDTYDCEGEITRTRPVNVTHSHLVSIMEKMVGVIHQVPPMYSALKKDGKPLYELARQGIEIDRPARRMMLQEFDLISFCDHNIEVNITCSSGFYVRSLAFDLGEILDCGAHVSVLRRTEIGQLSISQAMTLESLEALPDNGSRQSHLLPTDFILSNLIRIDLDEYQVIRLFQGQPVLQSGLPSNGLVRLYKQGSNDFLGIGLVVLGETIKPKRLINPDLLPN